MKTRFAILFLAFAAVLNAQTKRQQVTTPADQPGVTATTHQAVLTWITSTTCTDGTPCTPVAVTVYKIVATCAAPTTQFTKLASVAGNIRTYTDLGLAASTTYCYYVTASLAQPAAWLATTTYTGGQTVTYNNAVYVALNNASANLNQIPSTATNFWSPTSVESAPSNTAGGSTGAVGPPTPPSSMTITVQ